MTKKSGSFKAARTKKAPPPKTQDYGALDTIASRGKKTTTDTIIMGVRTTKEVKKEIRQYSVEHDISVGNLVEQAFQMLKDSGDMPEKKSP